RTKQKSGTVVTVEEFLSLDRPRGDLIIKAGREQVAVTSLDRIYWPDEKLTKFDLLSYYLKVADYIMPYLQDRPAILQRYPRGIKAPMFFQQDLESAPEFIKTARLTNQEGRELDYGVYTTIGSVLHFVNLGTIEQHPWHSTIKRLDKPDWIEIGLEVFPKTSGSSGLHIYVPLKPTNEYDKAGEFARLFASEVARRAPKIATVERALAKRASTQVYVDWMQNARGKSLAAVFTARARPKATVSMPLTWKQISKGVKIEDLTITNVPELLKKGDPWKDFFASRQTLKL